MDLIERAAKAAIDTDNGLRGIDFGSPLWAKKVARIVIAEVLAIPADPSDEDRSTYQALCDALDAAGYRPTGWVDPERLK